MIKSFKISTALMVCTVFLFRLLFVNIGILSSLNNRQNNNVVKKHFSFVMKRRKSVDDMNNSAQGQYAEVEICEEDLNDEDNFSKTNNFILISALCSFLSNKVAILKSDPLSGFVQRKLSSKKYLEISVLRI
jgi:hypothetical protein